MTTQDNNLPRKIEVTREVVTAPSRRLSARWTIVDPYDPIFRPPARESDQELPPTLPDPLEIIATQGPDVEEELARILQEEIIKQKH